MYTYVTVESYCWWPFQGQRWLWKVWQHGTGTYYMVEEQNASTRTPSWHTNGHNGENTCNNPSSSNMMDFPLSCILTAPGSLLRWCSLRFYTEYVLCIKWWFWGLICSPFIIKYMRLFSFLSRSGYVESWLMPRESWLMPRESLPMLSPIAKFSSMAW